MESLEVGPGYLSNDLPGKPPLAKLGQRVPVWRARAPRPLHAAPWVEVGDL